MSRKVFISCTIPDLTQMQQNNLMLTMEYELRNYKYQQVEGFFEGKKEISFMVSGVTDVYKFIALAEYFNQDSIMFVNAYKGATIVYTDAHKEDEFIGTLHSSSVKPWSGDYSYNPMTQEYYSVVAVNTYKPNIPAPERVEPPPVNGYTMTIKRGTPNQELSALCMHYLLKTDDTSGAMLEAMYIDYFNDYLTPEKYAEHNGWMPELAEYALELGREYNHSTRG